MVGVRIDRVVRFAFGDDGRDHVASSGIDHIPFRQIEGRHVKRLAVGGNRHAIAAVGVVPFLPDDLVGRQIEGREAARGADVEPAGGGVSGDALNRFDRLASIGFPDPNTSDELVAVIGVEYEDADPAELLVIRYAGHCRINISPDILGSGRNGKEERRQ
jgi:hypothetical protein